MLKWLRRSKQDSPPTLEATASVHDYGEHLNSIIPDSWSQHQIDAFWSIVGSCGTKSPEQIVQESAQCNGIVFTASHAWAETAAEAPVNVLHYVDGSWERVRPSHSVDAATVYDCLREIHPDCGEFEDLMYRAAFALASVGKANAFTYRLNPDTLDPSDYYQVAAPGSITPVRDGGRNGKVVGFDWRRSKENGKPIRVDKVQRMVWADPVHDHDPLMVWKPAAKWIELYDKLCLLLQIQVDQNSLGGLLWLGNDPSLKDRKSHTVDSMRERLEQVRKGEPTTEPIIGAGSTEPKFIEFPDVQEVIVKALPIVAREIGRLGPIEMGSLADGEVSGSHWAAAFRERHTLARLVGPLRRRVDAKITRWALTPKLQELKLSGQFDSDPLSWKLGHDLDAVSNRTDNVSDLMAGARLGYVGSPAIRRALRLKESDAPTGEDIERMLRFLGKSPSEIRDDFGDYDEDKSDPDRRDVGSEVFGRDPGPDTSGSVPSPVQRASAAADPYAEHDLSPGDPYEGAFAA